MPKKPDVVTVVLQLSEHSDQRRAALEALKLGSFFHGAYVSAISDVDEISVNERLEQCLADNGLDEQIEIARSETRRLPLS